MTIEFVAGWIGELVLAPLLTYALVYLRKWHINTTVLKAIARGAGAAYLSLREDRAASSLPTAVDIGADYVLSRVPDTLAKAGVNADAVREMVRAELGTLLAKKG